MNYENGAALPLSGKVVLATRSQEQSRELCEKFERVGARVLTQPALVVEGTARVDELDAALRRLDAAEFEWALFSSANGVRFALERVLATTRRASLADYFATRGVKVGSVGPGTTRALASYGVSATVEATKFEAEGLASAVANASRELVGARVLSFRGNRGRDALRAIFETFGAQYCEVEAYRTVDVERAYPEVLSELAAGRVDAAVATSSASAQSLAKMFGDLGSRTRWAALSPRTAEALRATGLEVAAIADEATMDSLVDAVVGLFER